MSFAIVNGKPPTLKQKILDRQLDELVAETGREEDRYNFCKILFKCLRDRPHIINSVDGSTGRKITNGEMLEKSIKTARALRAAGIGIGEVVMIIGVSHLELAIPFYAAFFNGNLPINVDVGATAYELDNFISVSKPKIIFSDAIKIDTVKQALSTAEVKSTIISFGEESLPDVDTFSEFMRPFSGDIKSFRAADRSRDDAALLLCTSGSTGLPKVPVLTHYCLVAQLPIFPTTDILHDDTRFELGSVKNMLILTSQWFAYYSAISVAAAFSFQRVQTPLRPVPQHVLQILRTHRPHTVFVSPSFFSMLLNHPDYKPGDLSSMYTILVTGAVVTPEMQQLVKSAINPDGVLSYTYGCTEMGGSILEPNSVLASIGEENNIMHYKIIDDDDKEVGVGQTGELLAKPKERFCKGFYNNEEATKDVFTDDGYFRTGDLVYRNEEGHYYYVDRKKLLITFNNNHIYPSELEGVIGSIPGVQDVAVCPSDKGPVGLVVKQPNYDLKEQDIHDVLKEKLSTFKQLVGGIYFVPALPKTVTNKLDRPKVKELFDKIQK